MPIQLYYWHSKGWAEPTRLLLHMFKVEYEEITWTGMEGWFAKKQEIFNDPIKRPFAKYPILIDDDFVVSEHSAINYYLCKKYNRLDLYGKNLQDEVRVRQMNGMLNEMMIYVVFFGLMSPDYENNLKKAFKEDGDIAESIKSFAGFLVDKDFLVGYLTLADIRTAYILKYARNAALSLGLEDPVVGKYENLVALIKRVDALPELEGFAGSDKDHAYIPANLVAWYKEFPIE